MNVFLDTSAVVKIYIDEADSQIVRNLYSAADNTIYIADIAKVEFWSPVKKRFDQADKVMADTFWIGVYPGLTTEMLGYMIEKMRELGSISLGKATELTEMSRVRFMEVLKEQGIPAHEYGEKSFEKDQQAIDRYRKMVEKCRNNFCGGR